MSRKPFLVLCLLFLVPLEGAVAHARERQDAANRQSGTWSARTAAGRTLTGTWTAVPDPKTGAVTGTWTLDDPQGKPVATGGWSAAKSTTGWTGGWRARVSGSKAEYTGTWRASIELKPDARFAELFETALKKVVSGTWRAGGQSGAWSIRAFD